MLERILKENFYNVLDYADATENEEVVKEKISLLLKKCKHIKNITINLKAKEIEINIEGLKTNLKLYILPNNYEIEINQNRIKGEKELEDLAKISDFLLKFMKKFKLSNFK